MKGTHFKDNEEKITLGMIITGIVIIAVLIVALSVYLFNIGKTSNENFSEPIEIISKEDEKDDEYNTVSIDIGKTVQDAEKELNDNSNNIQNNVTSNETKDTKSKDVSISKSNELTVSKKEENDLKQEKEEKEEINFIAPVKGKIIRDFAPDSLVYSETLEEWITHNGVDISSDKTSVVTCISKGTVSAIKNDPRYGITVIVNHDNGYQSVYANLLTAEYVVEGENIEQNQTIGTIGNTAIFEISDEYHLHFELLKDGEYINPSNFINFN